MTASPDTPSRHVLIVGAGYTGRRIAARLPAGQASVASRPDFDLDSSDPALPPLTPDYGVVYTVPPDPGHDTDHRLQRLLDIAGFAPATFVYLSTTGVYGDHGGGRVDEDTPINPQTDRARRRADAESRVQSWCEENNARCYVLRVPAIYGPGRLGIERLERRVPLVAEAEAGPGNRIHVDDLAACCFLAVTGDAPAGIYNVGDGDLRNGTAFAKEVANLAGLPAPVEVSMDEARRSFSAARMSFLEESRLVDTSRMREVLGFTPCYGDAIDGIRASLAAEAGG